MRILTIVEYDQCVWQIDEQLAKITRTKKNCENTTEKSILYFI